MTDLRKAAEMALKAWERPYGERGQAVEDAIEALRQALAQPEQEPVAWMHNFIEGNVITHKPVDIGRNPERWTPLYTAPPKREWVGLTKKEFEQAVDGLEDLEDCWTQIEAKLKEKNT